VHVTDPSNASRHMLFNLRTGDWDDELLDLFGCRARAACVSSSSEVYGERRCSRGRAVPIAGIAGVSKRRCSARPAPSRYVKEHVRTVVSCS